MTQEEKELLFKDLCGRLPYGVQLKCVKSVSALWGHDITLDTHWLNKLQSPFHEFKPYLFPLSSMTEEQGKIYHELIRGMFGTNALINFELLEEFFNKNHIDYRGLIPMGAAIDATNLGIYGK